MKIKLLTFLVALAGVAAPKAFAETPVVVEFYTSQSCAQCPRADELLGKLSGDKSLITLGCHVTYWDHREWKDTMSVEGCTQRQKDFGQALGGGRIYTPQAIVNGRNTMVGYRDDLISAAVRKQRQDKKVLPLPLEKAGEGYVILFPELPAGRQTSYLITVMTYGAAQSVKPERGENKGKNVTYAKPVTTVNILDYWMGKAERRLVSAREIPAGTRGIVVTAQIAPGTPVIAAGEYRLD